MAESEACARQCSLAVAGSSSSRSLGEYAVSARSDFRSTANFASRYFRLLSASESSSSWSLGEYAVSIRSDFRSAANFALQLQL